MTEQEAVNMLGNVDTLDMIGYAPLEQQQMLMGVIAKMPAPKAKQAIAKIVTPTKIGSANLDARDKAISRLGALPPEIQQALAAKRLQLVDMEIYSSRLLVGNKKIDFFKDEHTLLTGVRNLSNAKLPKDVYFLCTGIQFTTGVSATTTEAATDVPADAFFDLADPKALNGTFDFKINGGKYAMPKDSPLTAFGDNQYGGMKGVAKFTKVLDNPKWIEPQTAIEFNIDQATAATVAGTWGRVKLFGIGVISY